MKGNADELAVPTSLPLPGRVWVPQDALRFQFSRGGGPGGQNVNKVNTKAEAWLDIAGIQGITAAAKHRLITLAGGNVTLTGQIHLSSTVHRTQERNRQEVLDKLRELILRALVEPKRRRATKPTKASKRRRLEGKRHRGQIKSGRGSPGHIE
jgi:ribosome-associated protein